MYVLINGGSFFASSLISSNLKGSERAIFVGEETGGAYNGKVAGMLPMLKLPKSKLNFRLGLARLAPYYKTANDGKGVFPDLEIKPTLEDRINGNDPELYRVLNEKKPVPLKENNNIMKNQKLLLSFILAIFIIAFSVFNIIGQVGEKKINLDIVYIGNSITQGVQLPNPKEDAPPATATEYLRHKSGINSVEFSNQGKSGYTTIDFLPATVKAFPKVIEATHQLHNDNQRILIFSISLGTNDSAEEGPFGSPVDPKSYHANMKTIADKLLAEFPGCKIVFQQPIWYSPTTYNHSRYLAGGLARLQTYFPELQELVKEYTKSNPGQVFMGDVKAFEYFKNNYLTDLIPESGNAGTFYLHPNKKGAGELGKFWSEAIYNCIINN